MSGYNGSRVLPDALEPSAAACFAAVIRGAVNTREVAKGAGLAISTTFYWLRVLRKRGLVTWLDNHSNTLRPAYAIVAHTP